MCLLSKYKEPLIAENDIIAYKILKKRIFGYETPITGFKIKTNKLIRAEGCKRTVQYGRYHYLIGEGYFHAYINKNNAENYISETYQSKAKHYIVCEIIIPKGTKYYISNTDTEICAEYIIIKAPNTFQRIINSIKNMKK